jgi:hypothetical protein
VSIGAAPVPTGGEVNVGAAIEVRVHCRWDALALSEQLVRYHSFLVQRAADKWVVHARTPGSHGESLADALWAIEEWRAERGLEVPIRVRPRPA